MAVPFVVRGDGRPTLLIHGSAADRTTWLFQLSGLKQELRMLAYNRCAGDATSGLESGAMDIEAQAKTAAQLIEDQLGGEALVVGASFGAVVALELARRSPGRVTGLVMCEPPLASEDDLPPVPAGFGCAFDRVVARRSGEAAAEMFLRAVLSDSGFERLPAKARELACGQWRQVRADITALNRYAVRYDQLATRVKLPVLLVGGATSKPFYRDTLESLQRALPDSQLRVVPGAGHMMHVESHRQTNRLLANFEAELTAAER